jgi:hypothetical protein
MPALDNAKHELFAQRLAEGRTADEAYQMAGYAENRGNAIRLKANERVASRVAELLTASAEQVGVTVADITRRLLAIATKAEGKDDAPMLSVARATLMDVAKLNGIAPDKLQLTGVLGVANSAEPASLEELRRWAGEALAGGGETTH